MLKTNAPCYRQRQISIINLRFYYAKTVVVEVKIRHRVFEINLFYNNISNTI